MNCHLSFTFKAHLPATASPSAVMQRRLIHQQKPFSYSGLVQLTSKSKGFDGGSTEQSPESISVELETRQDTPDVSSLQKKCADFVHALMLGFDIADATPSSMTYL